MTSLLYFVVFALLGQSRSEVVELSCSDNATCIDYMTKEFARSIRQQKTVRLFDLFTIEPLENRQARSSLDPLTRLITSHAISFDWDDFTFRFSSPEGRNDALDLEVFESRTANDVSEPVPKKSKSKDEDEVADDKTKKVPIRRRRHRKRKVMQAIVPLIIGMKTAGVAIFALAMVTVITLKAFMASKVALLVTIGLAAKKFYESYSSGVGLQNNPYLYSQYPIDFPSASSHAYSISGVSPQFASQDMYSPTGMATHSHTNEMLQQNDASAQQSQQAPTLLVNSTRAAERWDGKSKLLKYLEPFVNKIKSVVDPIASVFYEAMPATFRGLNSDVSTAKSVESDVEELLKKPTEFLVPQPRHIAQRKMTFRKTSRQPNHRPKKYSDLKVDLDRLKHNKDYQDYIKTKKYKFNYPNTFYYPRIKYFVNPNTFLYQPNNKRLVPYRRGVLRRNISLHDFTMTPITSTTTNEPLFLESSEWRPIVILNTTTTPQNFNNTSPISVTEKIRKRRVHKKRKRVTRSINELESSLNVYKRKKQLSFSRKLFIDNKNAGRGFLDFLYFIDDPLGDLIKQADEYTKTMVHGSKEPPPYYTFAFKLVMYTLDAIEGLFEVHEAIKNHLDDGINKNKKKPQKKTRKTKKKTKPKIDSNINETDIVINSETE